MKEIIIYEYQLDVIIDALRITANIHDSRKGKSCFDRQVRQAEQFALNAKSGDFKKQVKYM